jgi:hypothetical protein
MSVENNKFTEAEALNQSRNFMGRGSIQPEHHFLG